jgi:hypothetical protein
MLSWLVFLCPLNFEIILMNTGDLELLVSNSKMFSDAFVSFTDCEWMARYRPDESTGQARSRRYSASQRRFVLETGEVQ